jgi:hypothetical protein
VILTRGSFESCFVRCVKNTDLCCRIRLTLSMVLAKSSRSIGQCFLKIPQKTDVRCRFRWTLSVGLARRGCSGTTHPPSRSCWRSWRRRSRRRRTHSRRSSRSCCSTSAGVSLCVSSLQTISILPGWQRPDIVRFEMLLFLRSV